MEVIPIISLILIVSLTTLLHMELGTLFFFFFLDGDFHIYYIGDKHGFYMLFWSKIDEIRVSLMHVRISFGVLLYFS